MATQNCRNGRRALENQRSQQEGGAPELQRVERRKYHGMRSSVDAFIKEYAIGNRSRTEIAMDMRDKGIPVEVSATPMRSLE